MTGTGLARDIATRAHDLHGHVPEAVARSARLHLLDALGVGAAGAARGPLRGLDRLARRHPGSSSVLGSDVRTSAAVAALVNGTLIHSLEFDDTHVASVMHGSSVVAATALAVAEEVGSSGPDLVSAFTIGWEVLVRMGLASPGTLQARGFQTTSAAGPFASALVTSLLRGEDVDTTVQALGIAGSQPGGTFAFLAAGDTVKAGQPGWAATSGVWAAELAAAGMTGPERVLEGPLGFFSLYADDAPAADRLADQLEDLGEVWHLEQAAFKLVPCCHFIHPFVEAVERALEELGGVEVAGVHCHVPAGAVPVIAAPWADRQTPATPHDARWSLPYVLAARIVDGRVDLDLFDSPVAGARLELSRRVTHEVWHDSGFPAVFPARVRVQAVDGRAVEVVVDDVLGGRTRQVPPESVVAKARANLDVAGLSSAAVEEAVREVAGPGELDVRRLARLLTPDRGAEPLA